MDTASGPPKGSVRAGSYSGRRVVDREGVEYGRVRHVHVDGASLSVCGVTVRHGLRSYFLPADHIEGFSEERLLLSRPPVREGAPVVDIDGRRVGRIRRLHKNPDTGALESVEVGRGLGRKAVLSGADIWGVGEKVTLRMPRDELAG